jgi:WD40 repeat protein
LVGRNQQATLEVAQSLPALEAEVQQAEERLKQHEAAAGQQQKKASSTGASVNAVAFSVDGSRLALANDDGVVCTFDGKDGSPMEVLGKASTPITELTYLSDGQRLVAASEGNLTLYPALPRWQLARTIGSPNSPLELAGRVTSLDFSPDGKLLASGTGEVSRRGQLKLWNVADGQLAREIAEAHDDMVLSVAFSPDGKQIASGGADRLVKVFDVDSGRLLHVFEGHAHHVMGVAWRADSRQLATCSADRTIKFWDTVTGDQTETITGFAKEVTAIRFVGLEPRVVVSAGDNLVTSRKTDRRRGPSFAGVSAYMYTVDCSRDGAIVVAGGHDGVVRVWTDAGKPIVTFMPPQPFTAAGQPAAK